MKKYAVPVTVKIKAIVTVEARDVAEAKRLVRSKIGHVNCLDANSVGTLSDTEGVTLRPGPIKVVNDELWVLIDEWDNERGVPW